jgi:hypothetical protein
MNRFQKFLLWLGYPRSIIQDTKITSFCKILSEFALEYRTTRDRITTQKQKKQNRGERNRTRGKLITEVCGIFTNKFIYFLFNSNRLFQKKVVYLNMLYQLIHAQMMKRNLFINVRMKKLIHHIMLHYVRHLLNRNNNQMHNRLHQVV